MAEKLTFDEIVANHLENFSCPCHHDGSNPPIPKCEHRTICNECVLVHRKQFLAPVCLEGVSDYPFVLPDMKIRYAEQDKWLADPETKKCACTQTFDGKPCKYKGRCKECIGIHRYYKSYVACMVDFPGKEPLRHDFKAE